MENNKLLLGFKLASLVIVAKQFSLGSRPPVAPPLKQEIAEKKSFFNRHAVYLSYLILTIFTLCVLCEIIATLSMQLPNSSLSMTTFSNFCPTDARRELTAIPISEIIGGSMIIAGQAIRSACFQSLGRFFTFQITIRPNHRLIATGPYAIVRHPGYTGSAMRLLGAIILSVGPGSYVVVCGLTAFPLTRLMMGVIPITLYSIYSLLSRGPIEDKLLHRRFGKEWEDYARRVPRMYIPGII
ncbi:hypothetical protein M422DRAFT_775839 [Sphaerobolus stellatus SS14]|nr:hypothetical protein M422DRAFT_775839 [Sphaerobolus stellatus SS14]